MDARKAKRPVADPIAAKSPPRRPPRPSGPVRRGRDTRTAARQAFGHGGCLMLVSRHKQVFLPDIPSALFYKQRHAG